MRTQSEFLPLIHQELSSFQSPAEITEFIFSHASSRPVRLPSRHSEITKPARTIEILYLEREKRGKHIAVLIYSYFALQNRLEAKFEKNIVSKLKMTWLKSLTDLTSTAQRRTVRFAQVARNNYVGKCFHLENVLKNWSNFCSHDLVFPSGA